MTEYNITVVIPFRATKFTKPFFPDRKQYVQGQLCSDLKTTKMNINQPVTLHHDHPITCGPSHKDRPTSHHNSPDISSYFNVLVKSSLSTLLQVIIRRSRRSAEDENFGATEAIISASNQKYQSMQPEIKDLYLPSELSNND